MRRWLVTWLLMFLPLPAAGAVAAEPVLPETLAGELQTFLDNREERIASPETAFIHDDSPRMRRYREWLDWKRRWAEIDPRPLSDGDWVDYHLYQQQLHLACLGFERDSGCWGRPERFLPSPDFFANAGNDAWPERLTQAMDALDSAEGALVACTDTRFEEATAEIEALQRFFSGLDTARLPAAARRRLATYRKRLAELPARWSPLRMPRDLVQRRLRERWYRLRLYYEHGLEMTVEEIVQTARRELAATHAAMAELAEQIRPGVTWQELCRMLGEGAPADLATAFTDAERRAEAFVHDNHLFARVPEMGAWSVRAEVHEAADRYPFGYYAQPEKTGGDGAFVVILPPAWWPDEDEAARRADTCAAIIPVIALHELVPGHHYQISLALQSRGRAIRRLAATPVLVEGWALYCEGLMAEQGFYTPEERFCQLRMRAWRCARAIVDPGLHLHGMTRAEAERLLLDATGFSPVTARAEVERFLDTPTQPLSYLMGCLQIEALRDDARRERGADFQYAGFHAELLRFGSIPPCWSARAMGNDREDE